MEACPRNPIAGFTRVIPPPLPVVISVDEIMEDVNHNLSTYSGVTEACPRDPNAGVAGEMISPPLPMITSVDKMLEGVNHDQLHAAVLEHMRWRTTKSGCVLDQRFQETLSSTSALLFVEPAAALSSSLYFRLLLLVFGGLCMLDAVQTGRAWSAYGVSSWKLVRLRIHPAYMSSGLSLSALSGTVELLGGNCSVVSTSVVAAPLKAMSEIVVANSSTQIIMDGFSVDLSSLDGRNSGVPFVIEGSNNETEGWRTIGQTSAMRKLAHGIRFVEGGGAFGANMGPTTFGLEAPWPLFLETALQSLLLVCCSFVTLAVDHLELFSSNPLAKKYYMQPLFCTILALNQLAAGIGYLSVGTITLESHNRKSLSLAAFAPLCFSVIYALVGVAAYHATNGLFVSWAALAALAVLVRVVEDCSLLNDCGNLQSNPPLACLIILGMSLMCEGLKWRIVSATVREARLDKSRLNVRCRRVLSRDKETLHALDALVDKLQVAAAKEDQTRHFNGRRLARPREGSSDLLGFDEAAFTLQTQRNRKISRHWSFWFKGRDLGPGTVDRDSPVQSLDQLYAPHPTSPPHRPPRPSHPPSPHLPHSRSLTDVCKCPRVTSVQVARPSPQALGHYFFYW